MIFKCPQQILIDFFTAKGIRRNGVNEMARDYFLTFNGVNGETLERNINSTLMMLGYTTGNVNDKLNQYFFAKTGSPRRGESDILFFSNTSNTFDPAYVRWDARDNCVDGTGNTGITFV